MFCKKPYLVQGMPFGCGQCIPCVVNKRREWAHRIMLEAQLHEYNSFVTLTYNDECLPADGSVDPRAMQLFMKKLRKSEEPRRLRFYGVGEYGEVSGRAHYHLAVFGMRTCDRVNTSYRTKYRAKGAGEATGVCCEVCTRVRDLWAQGDIGLGQLEPRSAAYVAGYVLKKVGSSSGLDGRRKPFARMSNRPGIGCFYMHEVASTLLEHDYEDVDVPFGLRHGGKMLPLGRYLRRKLREYIGRGVNAPVEAFARMEEKMQPLRAYAKSIAPKGFYEDTLRGVIQDVGLGGRLKLEGMEKRRRKVL